MLKPLPISQKLLPFPTKTKDLKNTSNIDNKESKEAPQSGLENKKIVSTKKKVEPSKKLIT